MNFMSKLEETLNVSATENLALGYKTTGKALLDLNFAVASLRSQTEDDIIKQYMKAYHEDAKNAIIWLFFARDIRGGLGERRLFRVVLNRLANTADEYIDAIIPLVAEYGRFDDLFVLLYTKFENKIFDIIKQQLESDIKGMESGENISLLAKWLPSINTSNKHSRKLARKIAANLGMNWQTYRKQLAKLRKYLDIIECKMSACEFDKIKYETVPSKANIKYKQAFLKQDEERRLAFLESLKKETPGVKINADVLYPYDIVHAYTDKYDETLEQLWKALPDIPEIHNTIVVADGSGSMLERIGGSSCTALEVANALAIYFAEHCSGHFKDKYITFSENPQLVDLSKGDSLHKKINIALRHREIANTDIYKVFQLILKTAKNNNMSQEEIPQNIIIISDMEFDQCADNANEKLFIKIANDYNIKGYKLPRLIFWNVNSRTGTIPVKQNDLGVALVSGFSISIAKMIMSLELDPYKVLIEALNNPRYDAVRNAIK